MEFRGPVDCAPIGSAEQCLIIRSGVTLSGGGSGRLRLVPGKIVLHTGMVRFDEGARNAGLRGLTIDGNRSSGADVCGVAGSSGGKNLRLSFVTLRACEHRSLITNGSPTTQPFVEGFVVEHSIVLDAGDKAFQFRNTRRGSCGGCFAETRPTDMSDPSDSAFEASNSEDIDFWELRARHLIPTTGPSFRAVNGSKRITFSQGRSFGGRQHILVIGSSSVHFRDLALYGGTAGALVQANDARHPEVHDVSIERVTFNSTGTEGIHVAASSPFKVRDVRINNCAFRGPMNYGINNTAGAGSIVQYNNVFQNMQKADLVNI